MLPSMDGIGTHHSMLLDRLYELEERFEPRSRYGYIHGELGPDHILVNQDLEPILIDIEGAALIRWIHKIVQLSKCY